MDRRNFLKAAPTALVMGVVPGASAAADVLVKRNGGDLTFNVQDAPSEESRFAAAVFPSKAWGVCAQQVQFEKGCMAGLDCDFPHETLIDIREGQFAFDPDKVPDLAVAVANPHDPDSWCAAQGQCAMAKRAGAYLTLLFAAHPYPDYRYPFDPRMLTYEPEGGGLGGADVVINFVSLNLREEIPRMVYAMTHIAINMPGIDLADIHSTLGGGKRAVYFRDTACGAARAARATRFACNQLGRSSLAGHGFNGGLMLMEANTWDINELDEIVDSSRKFLPASAHVIIGRVEHYDIDPWMIVHAILTYTAAS